MNPSHSPNFPTAITTVIDFTQPLPDRLTLPKFQLGQTVQWTTVSTRGFGTVIGLVYASGVSVVANGSTT